MQPSNESSAPASRCFRCRLDRLPPYLFAELERKVSEKKAAGVDVISLGIGDPDTPTPETVIDALAAAARGPRHAPVPVEPRPPRAARGVRPLLRAPLRRGRSTPNARSCPRWARRSASSTSTWPSSIPDSIALAADPGYPVYTGGPLLAGAEAVLMPLVPELGFAPDLDAIGGDVARRARLLYLNYPNNPTGAVVPDGLFERAVEFGREHDVLIVHDASYTETTYDGYVAPSFLSTPGAKEVGVEVFSLSKGWNMTGWRTAAIVGNADAVNAYWRLKTNIDSGIFEAVQLAAAAALDAGPPPGMTRRSTPAAATWSATRCARSAWT